MIPPRLIAGDSLELVESVPLHPAPAWTLHYRLTPPLPGQAPISLVGVAHGADHRVAVAAGVTAGWAAGVYTWARWVSHADGRRVSLGGGRLEISPDPAMTAAGFDGRSLAERTLADLLAARSTWATTQGRVSRYQIAGRTVEYRDAAELDAEIGWWRRQVAEEQTAARLAAGLAPRNRILVRWGR